MREHNTEHMQGMYDPRFEHDACGIGMLVDIKGRPSHKTVTDAINILESLTHRGGVGYEPETGDGAGILIQIPDAFMRRVTASQGIELPSGAGSYGVAMLFASPDKGRCETTIKEFCAVTARENLSVLGVRDVPVSPESIGSAAEMVRPSIRQVFIGRPEGMDEATFERELYIVGKLAQAQIRYREKDPDLYFYLASISCRTIVYKGMLLPRQLAGFYLDLQDTQVATAIALVHSRFSTNTFPSWERAHPMHHIIHNGEINTIRGNVNWVKAREARMKSVLFGDTIEKVFPVINEDGSDSAMLDDFLSLLLHAGTTLQEAVMMAIPEPWEEDRQMDPAKRAFYEYKSCLLEPWDGPASVAFTDGRYAGATLDRNGLRPSRYYVTKEGTLILASEVGVLPIPEADIVRKDRLRPGRMLLIDTVEGRIIEDEELKRTAAAAYPYRQWLDENLLTLDSLDMDEGGDEEADLEGGEGGEEAEPLSPLQAKKVFGYTWEDLTLTLKPMAETGEDPVSSMGADAPLAVLSNRPQLLYNYFKQLFAQVTNPPIDAIREHLITAATVHFGSEGNLLEPDASSCHVISHDTPILTVDDLQKLRTVKRGGFKSITLPILFDTQGGQTLKYALETLFRAVDSAIEQSYNIIILSDKGVGADKAPIPALLAVAGLHHHLVREGTRTQVSIVAETGEAREAHHCALLVGYGANGICPYLAYETVAELADDGLVSVDAKTASANYQKALTGAITKIASKMGISTVRSYHGAQIFEALGISSEVVELYFTGTPSRIGGVGLHEIEQEILERYAKAFDFAGEGRPLDTGGDFKWRSDGEYHLFNPETLYYLQQACQKGDYGLFQKFSASVNARSREYKNIRALLNIVTVEKPLPIDSVESVEAIVRRFKTGAMSFGSISKEAHETMAIAMNNLGGKSNTGEGGESPDRFECGTDGLNRCSSIKQVASGRFGVTIHYLNNATEIQIKMAQGAKPGEGGHLPGKKVYPWVASNRYSTPGVELISPPPHHDIYSIEDLAQLIHDLKNANRDARISVKLVSEAGVGTIAVGVAKGLADVIVISGFDGGTGAAPRTSIRHAGLPWELGIAEAHQSLVMNKLRDRVTLETDGKLLTGRDIVIAALLGAEEFAFATAPLVAMGCDMMRVCNLDTCPVGIATQNPQLRAKFLGKPEYVENLMRFMAQEVREWMARIGVRTFDELVGHVELLRQAPATDKDGKAQTVDLSNLLHQPHMIEGHGKSYFSQPQDHRLEHELDLSTILPLCRGAIERGERLSYHLQVSNRNRTVGTILSSEIVRRHGFKGLPEDSIHLTLSGAGGQSFGAFLAPGVTLELHGDTNDYLGKGLSGGKIIITPPDVATYDPSENIIAGNVAFYGATSGEAYLCGTAGERFCVRNSGVRAVVEGVGDHGCEYMTGGHVVILGPAGRNFAAGMSGGIAYIWDPGNTFESNCNKASVTLGSLSKADEEVVRVLLENHVGYTGSRRAEGLLEDFSVAVGQFVKVVPNDYQKIMDALEEANGLALAEDEGLLYAFNAVVLGKKRAG